MKFPWSHSTLVEVLKNESKLHHKCDKLTEEISSKKLDISEFVEELGPALTHEDASIRMKATQMLSTVLKSLPIELLTEKQLEFLVAFYCDRVKDHHSVIPAILEGVVALAAMQNFPHDSAPKLASSLFLNIPCQSQTKEERAMYFRFISLLADRNQDQLKAMGADFVYGVIGAIDGERDPRNLIFLFEYMPTFLERYPLLHLGEEMFEIFACYFPIDFHPNQNDPEAITRDMLAEKLQQCLCGSKEFAEYCVPLLLEKLESELIVAKMDSLRLLIKCTQAFDLSDMSKHLDDIWNALKLELMPGGGNKETIDLALETTTQIVKFTQRDPQVGDHFLTTIFVTVMGSIADVASKMFDNGIKVALACARATPESAHFVANKLLPMTLSQLNGDGITEQEKLSLVDVLSRTLLVCKEHGILKEMDQQLVGAVQKQFIQILVQESDSSELKKIALFCITRIPEAVVDENRFVVYTTIIHVLLSSSDERLNVEDCLHEFAVQYGVEVGNVIVDKLVAKKYEVVTSSTERVFHALAKLIPLDCMRGKILKFFLDLVFEECDHESLTILALQTLQMVLETSGGAAVAVELCDQYKFIEKCVTLVHKDGVTHSSDMLFALSNTMKDTMKQLPAEKQKSIVTEQLPSMDLTKANDLYLTSGILGYLDESVSVEDHFENLVDALTKLAMTSEDEHVKLLSQQLLCSLFNRMPDDDHHRNILLKLLKFLRKELKSHNKKVVGILSWIGKGLLARGHPEAGEIVDDIAELLDHPTLGHTAALAFEILSVEFPQLHLPLIKNLFKQKLFMLVMKKLEKSAEKFAENHLKALLYVYKPTPHLVLKMNIQKVGPMLLKCLQLSDDKALEMALEITLRFIKEQDAFFLDHLQTLIPQLLRLSVYQPSMKVRIDALECLLYATKYPPFLLLPFKQDVVLGLQAALDDHKRLVRNAAVAARLQWFVVASAETSNSGE
ncbi:MMS19 nucleotide excision repair protein [Aedes albopictus]|uniref:MMS19 nucleotide excision repair protein n=1 Tax=Aedes albopictus TaxID=7160 RepID=A0ABM1XNJ4_AEDAL|nr:MMS19 nucleotide excision repair protein homolog [Aedes albopictus]